MRNRRGLVFLLPVVFLQTFAVWSADEPCLKAAHDQILSENIEFKTKEIYETTAVWKMDDMRKANLSHNERKEFLFTVQEGRLVNSQGKELSIPDDGKPGEFCYSMDAAGNKFGSNTGLHHNDYLADKPAGAAGKLRWHVASESGSLRRTLILSDQSGHYVPEPWYIRQMLLDLQKEGYALDQILVDLHPLSGLPMPRAPEILPWISKDDPKMTHYLKHLIENPKISAETRSIAAVKVAAANQDPAPAIRAIQTAAPTTVMQALIDLGYMAQLELLEPIAKFVAQNRTQFDSKSIAAIDHFVTYVDKIAVIERTRQIGSFGGKAVHEIVPLLAHERSTVRAMTLEEIKKLEMSNELRDNTLTEFQKILPNLDPETRAPLQLFVQNETARGNATKTVLAIKQGDDSKLSELTELLSKKDKVSIPKAVEAIEKLLDDHPQYPKVLDHLEKQVIHLPTENRIEVEAFLNQVEKKKLKNLLMSYQALSEPERQKFVLGLMIDQITAPNPRTGKVILQTLHNLNLNEELKAHVQTLLKKKQPSLSPQVQQEADRLF